MCQVEYGPCDLFKSHSIDIHRLKEMAVRSHGDVITYDSDQDFHTKFIITGSNCTIAASERSSDTAWLVKVTLKLKLLKKISQISMGMKYYHDKCFLKGTT